LELQRQRIVVDANSDDSFESAKRENKMQYLNSRITFLSAQRRLTKRIKESRRGILPSLSY